MVEITPRATELVDEVRNEEGIPDSYGLRLYGETAPDGEAAVGIALAGGPAEGDEVVTEAPLPVFVAPEGADELGEAVVDAEGEPAPQRFVIRTP